MLIFLCYMTVQPNLIWTEFASIEKWMFKWIIYIRTGHNCWLHIVFIYVTNVNSFLCTNVSSDLKVESPDQNPFYLHMLIWYHPSVFFLLHIDIIRYWRMFCVFYFLNEDCCLTSQMVHSFCCFDEPILFYLVQKNIWWIKTGVMNIGIPMFEPVYRQIIFILVW